jgi:putative ABC transport system permease protein
VLMAQMALNPARFPAERRTAIFSEMLGRVAGIPGVEAAGITNIAPLAGGSTNIPFAIVGRPPQSEGEFIAADWRSVSPGFFSAVNIPLLTGRLITAADVADAPSVAVINQTMAERWWPDQDPIGKYIRAQGSQVDTQIVGIVGDIKDVQLAGPPNPAMYLSYQQVAWPNMTLLVRTSAQPEAIAAALREQVWAVEKTVPIPAIGTVADAVDRARTQPRFTMALFTGFSVIALLLAAIGIYGVVAFSVTQRTREIGIRMALGASAGDIRRLVLRGGALLALIGVAGGIAGALTLTRLMESFLFEVSPTDPATFIAVGVGMAGIALLATYVPARRATRVDPLVALRYE